MVASPVHSCSYSCVFDFARTLPYTYTAEFVEIVHRSVEGGSEGEMYAGVGVSGVPSLSIWRACKYFVLLKRNSAFLFFCGCLVCNGGIMVDVPAARLVGTAAIDGAKTNISPFFWCNFSN